MHSSITAAAVQMDCQPNRKSENFARADSLVRSATSQNAQLVLLPEFALNGYLMTTDMWAQAEPFDGPCTAWLREVARATNAYVGTTFLEVDGEHFFNTFALADPSGKLFPRVRKSPPAGPEAFFFTSGDGPHCFNTELGRVGVGICFENFLSQRIREFHSASVDFVLQPFSAPTPIARFPLRKLDVRISDAAMRDQPAKTAQALGVPVIMANRCGRFVSSMPGRLPAWDTTFPGLSAIVDGDGTVKGQLAMSEGVLVATVHLDPQRKAKLIPDASGSWAMPVPWWYAMLPLIEKRGRKAYANSRERRDAAILSGGPQA